MFGFVRGRTRPKTYQDFDEMAAALGEDGGTAVIRARYDDSQMLYKTNPDAKSKGSLRHLWPDRLVKVWSGKGKKEKVTRSKYAVLKGEWGKKGALALLRYSYHESNVKEILKKFEQDTGRDLTKGEITSDDLYRLRRIKNDVLGNHRGDATSQGRPGRKTKRKCDKDAAIANSNGLYQSRADDNSGKSLRRNKHLVAPRDQFKSANGEAKALTDAKLEEPALEDNSTFQGLFGDHEKFKEHQSKYLENLKSLNKNWQGTLHSDPICGNKKLRDKFSEIYEKVAEMEGEMEKMGESNAESLDAGGLTKSVQGAKESFKDLWVLGKITGAAYTAMLDLQKCISSVDEMCKLASTLSRS